MIKELLQSKDPVLGFEVTGKVSVEEKQNLISRVEGALKKHDKVSALVVLGEKASWGVKAGIQDLKNAVDAYGRSRPDSDSLRQQGVGVAYQDRPANLRRLPESRRNTLKPTILTTRGSS